MTPDEIRKLLGGYATGTLTEEERNLLFSAALEDQELFNALADEEALRELLAEPATRQILLEELQRQPTLEGILLKDQRGAAGARDSTPCLLRCPRVPRCENSRNLYGRGYGITSHLAAWPWLVDSR